MTPAHRKVLSDELGPLGRRTVLITGANGMLGSAFREILETTPGCRIIAFDRGALDVTDQTAVLALQSQSPDLILHCAGETDADRCERDPGHCRAVHVGGTEHVIALARASGATVVYPQSVLIFDGREIPVSEHTVPNPLSEYGRAKLAAEEMLVGELPESLVVRMAGFFGGEARDKNFVGKFAQALFDGLERGEHTCRVGERIWQPSYTRDLAGNTLLLLALGRSGIYHMGAHGEASFRDVACACVDELGLGNVMTVLTLPPADQRGLELAPRPYRMVTTNRRLTEEGLDRQRHWRAALSEYLAQAFFQIRARRSAGIG